MTPRTSPAGDAASPGGPASPRGPAVAQGTDVSFNAGGSPAPESGSRASGPDACGRSCGPPSAFGFGGGSASVAEPTRPAGVVGACARVARAAAAAAVLLAAACGAAPRPTSVLLVTVDTLRPDHLGCHGYTRPTSPALDALAARGARFERAWSHAPETQPSLATVMTSRRAPVTGIRANAEPLGSDLPTLATTARAAGLRTGAFVSTVLLRRDASGLDRGFDVYDDTMTDPCFGHARAQRIASRTVDAALLWLAAEPERPFLLWVHLYDPHGPYEPPERAERLGPSLESVPSAVLSRTQVPRYQRVRDSLDARDYIDRYDHEIAYADAQAARLFAAVDPATTLVVVHADHGESLGEDGYWFRHGALLHDAALRVPWIVAGPGVPSGHVVVGDVPLVALAPTVLALAGLPPLPVAEGRDVSDAVRGRGGLPPMDLVAEARRREFVADATGIDVRWKLRRVAPSLGIDVTWWPATDERRPAAGASAPSPADADPITALRVWLQEPDRERARPATKPPKDIPEALEGLGYR